MNVDYLRWDSTGQSTIETLLTNEEVNVTEYGSTLTFTGNNSGVLLVILSANFIRLYRPEAQA